MNTSKLTSVLEKAKKEYREGISKGFPREGEFFEKFAVRRYPVWGYFGPNYANPGREPSSDEGKSEWRLETERQLENIVFSEVIAIERALSGETFTIKELPPTI